MPIALTAEQARWFRLRRSGLVDPFNAPEEAASALIGVQAQILPAAGVALWNRTRGLTHVEFERLLFGERTLLKLWGQRHTLHLYPSAEWPTLWAAFGGEQTWWEMRVERDGGDASAYRDLVARTEQLLRERNTLGRSDLRASDLPLEEWHLSGWGGLFADLVRRGYACHAQHAGGEARFAHRTHWLPDLAWEPPPPEAANIAIARRFLHTYGPATASDLAYWRGIGPITPAKTWLTALGDEVTEVEIEGRAALALRADLDMLQETPPERDEWPVRMLYRFDPLLLGLKDKEWILERALRNRVWRPAAHIEATILEHGRIVGTWRYDRKPRGLLITLTPFAPLPVHARAAVERDAQGIADFFGVPLLDILNVQQVA